jgi:two-component system, NarL family, nitrate/nitrite response regulator NarL
MATPSSGQNGAVTAGPTEESLTVVVGERRPVVRQALRRLLGDDAAITVIDDAADTKSLLVAAEANQVNVVVVAHQPPLLDAFEVVRGFRPRRLSTRVIVLVDCSPATHRAFLDCGASACMSGSVTARQLLAAIAACGVLGLDLPYGCGTDSIEIPAVEETSPILSEREQQVLRMIAADKNPKAIATELYLSTATVRSHLARIYRKLSVSGAPAAVAEGFRRGVLF